MAQPLIAFAIDVFRIGQKTPVAIDIGGAEGPDLRLKLGVVVRIVELRPVLPIKAITRMDRHTLPMGGDAPPAQPPQLLKADGIGDDWGPGVNGADMLFHHLGPAAGLLPRS